MDIMGLSRTALRRKLLDERNAMDERDRRRADHAIRRAVSDYLSERSGADDAQTVIACYWPIQGEPDLRPLWQDWGQVALPVVVMRDGPLRFARWHADTRMKSGTLGIPVPTHPEWIEPGIVVVPCLGFFVDASLRLYRLGYGGGYYDRTLEGQAIPAVGVAYAQSQINELAIGQHDVALDAIITERSRLGPRGPLGGRQSV